MVSQNFERDFSFRIAAGASLLMLILILTACIAAATPPDLPVTSSQISGSEPIPFSKERIIKPHPHPAAPFADHTSTGNAPVHTQAENNDFHEVPCGAFPFPFQS